jgi:hypothetical protein
MTYALLFLLILICLVFVKYHIDTKNTIKELRLDKNKFRDLYWRLFVNKDSGQKLNWLYQNVKKQIEELIKDLEDTDFENYNGDIKKDVIGALKNIDEYSTTIENQDMDSLTYYRGKDGNSK